MAGILDNVSVNLEDRVTLNAPSNDNLEFIGNLGADVAVDGVNDCIVSGNFNTGTILGGHAIVITGERNSSVTVGALFSMGNGLSNINVSPRMPQAGKVVALTVSSDTASTGTWAVTINTTTTAFTVSLAATTSNYALGSESFAAGDTVCAIVTVGTFLRPKVGVFVVYD